MLFANSHTGPSGTVKLAKKEPAAKPAASSTKEKKPAAKVHILAHTLIQKSDQFFVEGDQSYKTRRYQDGR